MCIIRPTEYVPLSHDEKLRQAGYQFLLHSDPGQKRDAVKSR
jgi:hypothetical protein